MVETSLQINAEVQVQLRSQIRLIHSRQLPEEDDWSTRSQASAQRAERVVRKMRRLLDGLTPEEVRRIEKAIDHELGEGIRTMAAEPAHVGTTSETAWERLWRTREPHRAATATWFENQRPPSLPVGVIKIPEQYYYGCILMGTFMGIFLTSGTMPNVKDVVEASLDNAELAAQGAKERWPQAQ